MNGDRSNESPGEARTPETATLVAYFAAYVSYLFVVQESEIAHWASLVVLPFGLVYYLRRRRDLRVSPVHVLESVGLRRGNLTRGLGLAVLIGLAISVFQLFASRRQEEVLEIILSGRVLYLLPLVIGLLAVTAGLTEEFFFRGVLQTRLTDGFRSKLLGIATASFLFGLYHLPYAYLNPASPSHGDWPAALASAFGQGIPMGIILGWIYEHTDGNLLACIIVHTLANALPAMTMVKGL